jgi:succinoglycan biosynthesis transport protein ExoP
MSDENKTPNPAPAPTSSSQVIAQPTSTETLRTSILLPPHMLQAFDQGPVSPSALTAAPTAFTLFSAFQRRWPLAIGAGLLAAALSALAIMFVFPARFTTYYCAKVSSIKGGNAVLDRAEEADFNVFKSTQAALAKSRPVILRALDSQSGGRFIKDLSIVRDAKDPVEWLQTAIKTDFNKSPEIMTVQLSADQASELTMLLNALGKSLIEENRNIEETKHNDDIETVQAQAKKLQAEIDLKRRAFFQRMAALGENPISLGKKLDQLDQELRDAKKTLRDKQTEIAGVRSRIDTLSRRIESPSAFPIPEQILNDFLRQEPDAQELYKRISVAKTHYADAVRLIRDPNSQDIRRYLDQVDQAERALEAYRRSKMPEITRKAQERMATEGALELTKLRDDLVSHEQQENTLKNAVSRLENETLQYRPNNMPAEVVAMQNDIEGLDAGLKSITQKIQFMKVNVPSPRVSILQDAIEPSNKDTSRQMKLMGAGSIGMFLITVLGVSFFEFRSRKITSSDEVKQGLGLTVIGTVPAISEKSRSTPSQSKLEALSQTQLMESVDTIRTMLLHTARSNNTRVIMVTSAVGGEGKTSLSSQLAASMARAWKKTLLIDGDLRNPSSHKIFDLPQEPGLSEVLRGELTATDAVRSTPLSRLWVLPAGHWDNHAVQALAQDNVRTILEELKQQYDFIILDSCPVLPVADSLLLGQNVDGVILTVMREISRSPAVHAAHQRLESLGIKTLGAVVIGARNELGPLGFKYANQARPS